MGNPIISPDYELGNPCIACWGDSTPKRVLACVSGVRACPPITDQVNGEFILTQISPCEWQLLEGNFTWIYMATTLGPPWGSAFNIGDFIGSWFAGNRDDPCMGDFTNDNIEDHCNGLQRGYGGSVSVLFGPGI